MTPTLRYDYSRAGRERLELACDHGSTVLRGLEAYVTPEPFTALIIRHRSRYGCTCEVERMIRHWPDARLALAQHEAFAVDVPAEVDSLDIDVMLADLTDLRANVPCPGCVPAWTATSDAGGLLGREYHHDPACPEIARRRRKGQLRGTHSTLYRTKGRPS